MIRRREFITLLGGTAAAWPLAARAQQPAMPIVGLVSPRSPEDSSRLGAVFRKALNEAGYIEGQNKLLSSAKERPQIAQQQRDPSAGPITWNGAPHKKLRFRVGRRQSLPNGRSRYFSKPFFAVTMTV